jgi:protein-S-isoprenylcysteine O-methyltransferase Ste14
MFDTPPLLFIWPHAIVFWTVLVCLYAVEGRQLKRKMKQSGGYSGDDRYSGLVISVGSTFLQVAAVLLAFNTAWSMGAERQLGAFYGGLAIVVSGTLLRMHCWAALGKFFTHTVTIAADHQVVNIGAYRWLRHPSYLGALLNLIGLGISLGNWASVAVITLGSCAIYAYRIEVEEAALESALGDAYRSFKQSRARLIPFVY